MVVRHTHTLTPISTPHSRGNFGAFSSPIEASFPAPVIAGLLPPEPALPPSIDVAPAKPLDGAIRNPDVERYDPTGLRGAVTAGSAATQKALQQIVENHVPRGNWSKGVRGAQHAAWAAEQAAKGVPAPVGKYELKRISPWQDSQERQW